MVHVDVYALPDSSLGVALGVDTDRALELQSSCINGIFLIERFGLDTAHLVLPARYHFLVDMALCCLACQLAC